MKKLALKLDELTVETFTTAGSHARPGTVRGRAQTLDACESPWESCDFSVCYYDCSLGGSCPGTCVGRESAPACC
jgi:hypothetical protein